MKNNRLQFSFSRPWEADSLLAAGSKSVSNLPTTVNHPHHHPIVFTAAGPVSQQRFTEQRGGGFYAHCRARAKDASPVGKDVNMNCNTFSPPQGFSVCICARVCADSELAPSHPTSRQYSNWDVNRSLMRCGGVY